MKVINVIVLKKGNLQYIKSFVIEEFDIENEKVKLAEQEFEDALREEDEAHLDSGDIEFYTEQGEYSNNNGFQAFLVWSEIM